MSMLVSIQPRATYKTYETFWKKKASYPNNIVEFFWRLTGIRVIDLRFVERCP